MTHFCPSCWREIEPSVEQCPVCQFDLAAYWRLSYQGKLFLALRHPIRENRLIAIQILGDLKCEQALGAFREILREEDHFYVLRDVLQAALRQEPGRGGNPTRFPVGKHVCQEPAECEIKRQFRFDGRDEPKAALAPSFGK